MNRLKSAFLANMSHELRTPLNVILGYTELVADGIYGPVSDDAQQAMRGITDATSGLLSLISQILDLSKVEAGKMQIDVSEVDISALADEATRETEALARDRPYSIQLNCDTHVVIRTDAGKVKQILRNLLSNAVKFTAEGWVELIVSASGEGGCTMAVRDTGIGIRAEDLDQIFEEFRQVDGSYTRSYGGTGLGLAIARRFAHLLGGEITVESQVGIGSTFTLRLPPSPPGENS